MACIVGALLVTAAALGVVAAIESYFLQQQQASNQSIQNQGQPTYRSMVNRGNVSYGNMNRAVAPVKISQIMLTGASMNTGYLPDFASMSTLPSVLVTPQIMDVTLQGLPTLQPLLEDTSIPMIPNEVTVDTSLPAEATILPTQTVPQQQLVPNQLMGTYVYCYGYCEAEVSFIPAEGTPGGGTDAQNLGLKFWIYTTILALLTTFALAISNGRIEMLPAINYMTYDELEKWRSEIPDITDDDVAIERSKEGLDG